MRLRRLFSMDETVDTFSTNSLSYFSRRSEGRISTNNDECNRYNVENGLL